MESCAMPMNSREQEQHRLSTFLAITSGQSLVLRGEPATGKSALLEFTAELAVREGYTTVRARGVEAESHIPYAGLHQLLYPLLPYSEHLDERARAVFDSVFGHPAGTPPTVLTLGIAVLNLLSAAASERPLLLVLDDGHWFDDASAEVCGFVGRRLSWSSVKLLVTVRADVESPFDAAAMPETRVSAQLELPVHIGRIDVQDQVFGEVAVPQRARMELVATLTWQERRIADLAACGLTNKEIGRQLYLSPRTVSSHLYRIFPKLGITTRAALRDALNRQQAMGA
ncbi:LuxR family transcriptional regulator [Nocardia vinacea]